jgi:thioester reductase-like protein
VVDADRNTVARVRGVDRRAEGERIEGGGGGGVADLLARLRAKDAAPAAPTGPSAPPAVPAQTSGGAEDARPQLWDQDRLSAAIAATAARFLGAAEIGPDTDLFDAGASSVAAVEFVAALARELNVRLNLDDVFADARPRRLARLWLGAIGTATPQTATPTTSTEIVRRAALEPTIDPDDDLAWIQADLARADGLPFVREPEPGAPRRILLTGANGFLGGHLLLELLRRGRAHVVCLVRGTDDADAERRLAEGLASFDLPWNAEVRRRVTVLAGDIRQPRLGLSDERWETLARDVDSIVGVAAAVDFVRGYVSLRQTNVLGPLQLAELATTGRIKPLHHISSIAVFNEVGITSMGEDDPVAHIDGLAAGYDKTKWAAEAALRRAREHGLVVTFLRPGGIGGHTRTGAYNPRDLSSGFMSAFTRFRKVPALRYLNVAPVDWVSRVAATVIGDPAAWGKNYNLAGRPNTLPDLVRDMQISGMNVRVQDWDEWRADFLATMAAEPVPEIEFLARVMHNPAAMKLCEATLFGPAATGERTDAFVAKHKLPAAKRYDGRAQLKTYERLVRDGLARLPSPQDPPYLWFHETMRGRLAPVGSGDSTDSTGPAPTIDCELSLTISIASMYQLAQERRADVRGEAFCAALHDKALTVEDGSFWVRPDDGTPKRHGPLHPLLRYRLRLRDRDGRSWWLAGQKTAAPRRDLLRQARTLAVEIGREGGPAEYAGVLVVPGDTYVKEQIDGIEVDPRLSPQEQRTAKLLWLAWFGSQVGAGLIEPGLRAAADLLDLRHGATGKDKS